jgi:hypothetical protein
MLVVRPVILRSLLSQMGYGGAKNILNKNGLNVLKV